MPLQPFNPQELFRFTESPNPSFQPVIGTPDSKFLNDWKKVADDEGFTAVDPLKTEPRAVYRLLISGVIPRPIAFVSTLSPNGEGNLAPFSYFNLVHYNPAILSVSFNHHEKREKDSCANIKATKTFTVNIISEPFVEAANWCCVDAPPGVEEWEGSGLTKEKSTLIDPPRVKESAFSMECELYQAIDIFADDVDPTNPSSTPKATLVLGRIKLIHVRNDVLVRADPTSTDPVSRHRDHTVDPAKLRAVSRMGGITYGRVGEGFQIPRPIWDEVKDSYNKQSNS
ncbi:hypothetical protein FRC03_005309 [Tulasnella sp. 419]|nr:hypothetical protein FRC03_005309 [Tulasnella sp. 419]